MTSIISSRTSAAHRVFPSSLSVVKVSPGLRPADTAPARTASNPAAPATPSPLNGTFQVSFSQCARARLSVALQATPAWLNREAISPVRGFGLLWNSPATMRP
jgi:hypothetical protein